MEDLYTFYGQPQAWAVMPGAVDALYLLRSAGETYCNMECLPWHLELCTLRAVSNSQSDVQIDGISTVLSLASRPLYLNCYDLQLLEAVQLSITMA